RGSRSTITTPTGTESLTFDAYEQLAQDGDATYTYDAQARLTKRNGQPGFAYDGPTNNLVADGPTTFTRGPAGDLISTGNATTAQLAITDQHGDVTATLDPTTKTRTSSTTYDPFGQITTQSGPKPGLGYQGAWTDPTTGQVNMASRWYDPTNGGFDSRDTWTLNPTPSGNANRYAYALADPLNGTDPTGHCVPSWTKSKAVKTTKAVTKRSGWGLAFNIGWEIAWEIVDQTTDASGGGPSSGGGGPSSGGGGPSGGGGGGSNYFDWGAIGSYCPGTCDMTMGYTPPPGAPPPTSTVPPSTTTPPRWIPPRTKYPTRNTPKTISKPKPRPKTPVKPKPKPHVPTAPKSRSLTPSTAARDPMVAILDSVLAGVRVLESIQSLTGQGGAFSSSDHAVVPGTELTLNDAKSLDHLQSLFPEAVVPYPFAGIDYGLSGVDPSAKNPGNSCQRDFPARPDEANYYYAPMTRYGPGVNDCRATGAVAVLTNESIRKKEHPEPMWRPSGYDSIRAATMGVNGKHNAANLHLIGNQLGGAHYTLRNFVAGYQNPANNSSMKRLENDIRFKGLKSSQNETIVFGTLPVYGNPAQPAIPTEIHMKAYGSKGYALNCIVYNSPTGNYTCSERSSGGPLYGP
ncbi:RHS repeat-associated core domain-containing protein, partial [Streptomyces sp. SID3343]|uniref:RHS repeat-associated core domain-containing protein n=1 Tax=Streptomyces sp. SID3343 TaxID=2690260 RepID=UPI0013BFB97B